VTPSSPPALPLGRITVGLAILALVIAGVLAGQAVQDAKSGEVRVVTIAPRAPRHRTSTETLAEALDRCRLAGPSGADEPACRSAWAQSRNHFFSHPTAEISDE